MLHEQLLLLFSISLHNMTVLSIITDHLIQVVHAASPIEQYCQGLHPGCTAGAGFVIQLSGRVIDILSELIGGAAVIMVIYGGGRIAASGGNEEGRTQGKNIIVAALVGIALAILGKAFVDFVAVFAAAGA